MITLGSLSRITRRARLTALSLVLISPAQYGFAQGRGTVVQPVASTASATSSFDAVMKDLYPADKPGATVIVVKDGTPVFRKAYGMADLELGVPLRPEMVLRLGSITKQFTATSILMLVDEGKVSLQDRIEKYLPDYPTHGKTITIEHLLTHTSGIQSYTSIPGWMDTKILAPLKPLELIEGFKSSPMNFDPGERYLYNNSGYVLLGAIIENVTGKPYARFIEDRIFKPLGMSSSYYGDTEPIIKNRVPGYTAEGKAVANMRYLSMTQPYSAGSLMSTVDDLAKWDASLYTQALVRKAGYEKAWTPFVLNSGKATEYGYGWGIRKLRGRRSIEHGGGIFGFSTYALRVPEARVFVAVLCNSDSPVTDPGYVARRLAAVALGQPFAEKKAVAVDPRVLERYVGVYRVDANTTRTASAEGGKLYLQRSGGSRSEVVPSSETEFFYDKSLTSVRFVVDANGRATELLMFPDGADEPQRAPRVSDAPAASVEAKVDPSSYDAYVGAYELAPTFILTISREGDRLWAQATGQGKNEIFPKAENEFFLKVVDAQISFVRAGDGSVESLVLHQGGRDMKAPRRK